MEKGCNIQLQLCHVWYYPTPRHTRSGGCSAEALALEGRGGGSKGVRRGWSRTAVPRQVCKQGCQPQHPGQDQGKGASAATALRRGKAVVGLGHERGAERKHRSTLHCLLQEKQLLPSLIKHCDNANGSAGMEAEARGPPSPQQCWSP